MSAPYFNQSLYQMMIVNATLLQIKQKINAAENL